ncbi:MAG: GNAT family protein [Gammaproteobacteria bacterium]|nr:GNAT family protein [Gammaproteobacteria bacterium]
MEQVNNATSLASVEGMPFNEDFLSGGNYYIVSEPKLDICNWVHQRVAHSRYTYGAYSALALASSQCPEGEYIFGAIYFNYTEASVAIHIALGSPKVFFRHFDTFMSYPFDVLGVKKVLAYVHSENARMIQICKKLGFISEGCVENVYPGGYGINVYSVTKDRCTLFHKK